MVVLEQMMLDQEEMVMVLEEMNVDKEEMMVDQV